MVREAFLDCIQRNTYATTVLGFMYFFLRRTISDGNRTEWSPIQSVIIQGLTRSDDREAGVLFDNHEYDWRLNWTTQCPVTN